MLIPSAPSSVVYLRRFVPDPTTGKDAVLRGYAAVYRTLSSTPQPDPLSPDRRKLPEILAPGCFDRFLAKGCPPQMQFQHLGRNGLLSSSVRMWSDGVGLAFEASQLRNNDQTQALVRAISQGLITGCSWMAQVGDLDIGVESVGGIETLVIRECTHLIEFGPAVNPVYFQTGVWLASAQPERLPGHLWSLATTWQKSAVAIGEN
jgi:phage head maturation protease